MKKLSILLLAVSSILFTSSCTRIDVGHVGLKVDQTGDSKGVNPMKYVTGWVFYNPISSDVVQFPTYMQHVEYDEFKINAHGGSQFTIKPYINYTVNSSEADSIYQVFKTTDLETISERYIRNAVYQTFTDITGKYSPDDLLKFREKYEREVFENLKKSMLEQGFILEQVTSNMVPPEALIVAIDAKNKVDQEAQGLQLEVAKSIAQANKDIAEAKGDSASTVIRAKGNAKAYELQQQSLTPLLVEKMRIDKWSGNLPTTVLGNSQTLLNLK